MANYLLKIDYLKKISGKYKKNNTCTCITTKIKLKKNSVSHIQQIVSITGYWWRNSTGKLGENACIKLWIQLRGLPKYNWVVTNFRRLVCNQRFKVRRHPVGLFCRCKHKNFQNPTHRLCFTSGSVKRPHDLGSLARFNEGALWSILLQYGHSSPIELKGCFVSNVRASGVNMGKLASRIQIT